MTSRSCRRGRSEEVATRANPESGRHAPEILVMLVLVSVLSLGWSQVVKRVKMPAWVAWSVFVGIVLLPLLAHLWMVALDRLRPPPK